MRAIRRPIPPEEEYSRRGLMIAGVVAAVMLASTLVMVYWDATAGAIVPMVAVLLVVMMRWPLLLYALALASFSILPIEHHFIGFYVPNLMQFLVPGLLLAIVAKSAVDRDWGAFRIRTADVFVVAFITFAFVGIFVESGPRQHKWFVNQVLFAIMFYFATRWLRLNRARFRLVLKYVLVAAGLMLADLVLVQLTGFGRLWNGAGPLKSLSDQATYSALFPPLFLYMAVTSEEDGAARHRPFWLLLALISVIAVAGVTERSGVAAGLLAVFVCIAHPRMFRYVAIGIILLIPVGAWWLSTSVGSHVQSRFTDDEDPMLRRRVYVGKAIDYIRSDRWHPLWGTGFGRLAKLSNEMLSTTEVVWDPNRMIWRTHWEVGQRNIHCAPVTVFGEYGYAGVFCLVGLGACVVVSVLFAAYRARRLGAVFDTALLVALGGSALGLLINALFHNTDTVFPVTALFWATTGLLVGHPDVLMVKRPQAREEAESETLAQARTAVK